jgi:methionyl-tRNA formyltransferase
MRAVFFGTPAFAVPALNALLDAGVDVAAVVSQPDRANGRSHSTLTPPPVKRRALDAGIPVWQPERPRGSEFVDALTGTHADLAVVVAYGHLLRPEILAIPRFGFVNVHASLLPRWRGAAPIQRALLAGDAETGVSIMRIEAGLDSGAVWHTRHTPITETDTTATLFVRLADLGAMALMEALPRIASGEAPVNQPEHGITHAGKIDRETARIRWDEPTHAVSCRIRAMDPAPGAWTTLHGAEIKLFQPTRSVTTGTARTAGRVDVTGGRLTVDTFDGALEIAEVQPAGKRRMAASEWMRGAHVAADACFG